MKYLAVIILTLLLPFWSTAQNGVYFIPTDKHADSVRILLKRTNNDTLKTAIFYDLSAYYTELNKDTSLYYADRQLEAAKNLRQPLWAADACFQIAYVSHGLGNYPKAFNAIAEGLAITDDPNSEKTTGESKRSLTAFSGIKSEIKEIFGQGNKLTKHWVFSGVHTGDFYGVAPAGKSVRVECSTIVRMENGIIMEKQDFFDNLDLLTQLGVY